MTKGYLDSLKYVIHYCMTSNYKNLPPEYFIKELTKRDSYISELSSKIEDLESEIKNLELTVANLRKRLFGRKSEKLKSKIKQSNQTNSTAVSADSNKEDTISEETKERRKLIEVIYDDNTKGSESEFDECEVGVLPAELERKEERIDDKPKDWSEEGYSRLKDKITERLCFIPGRYIVKRYIRSVYVKKSNSKIMQPPPAPEHVLGRCMVDETVITKIIIDRFYLHLPYYRQEKEFKLYGLNISRDNMYRWCNKIALLFAPIVNALEEEIKSSAVIHIDETPFSMKFSGEYKRAYFWPLLAHNIGVAFRWTEYRNGETLSSVMDGIREGSTIVADGLNLYKTYTDNNNIYLQSCFAHIRRKFDEARVSNKELAEEGLIKIGLIFKSDKEILNSSSSPEDIFKRRQQIVAPLFKEFISWSEETSKLDEVISDRLLSSAFKYFLERQYSASTFLSNPFVKIHNNDNERESKNFKLGAKNWLFASSDSGADALCVFYSLIQTAIMHKVNPYDYLLSLCQLIDKKGLKAIDLIPQNWKNLVL